MKTDVAKQLKRTVAIAERLGRVEIRIKGGKIVDVNPDYLPVELFTRVYWVITGLVNERVKEIDEPFSIEFTDPFCTHTIPYAIARQGLLASHKGRYKYTVVLDRNPLERRDPEIEVDPPPQTRKP